MTNILASVVVCLMTNVYHPTQWKSVTYHPTYPVTVLEKWVDTSPYLDYENMHIETRENPDVRITEVRRLRRLEFDFEGMSFVFELSNDVISSKREKRTVTEEWQ